MVATSHTPSIRVLHISSESPAADESQRFEDISRAHVQIADGSMTPAFDFYPLGDLDLDDICAVARRCYLAGVRDAGGDVDAAAKALERASRATLAEMEQAVRDAAGGASLSVELEGDAA